MSFFDSLRRVLIGDNSSDETAQSTTSPTEEDSARDGAVTHVSHTPSAYDQAQWHKKLKRILDELPASQAEWAGLMTEAKALELDPEWIAETQREEFLLQIRRAVSDRVVTEEEHRKLDLCRKLIGISDREAEASLHAIVAEAESFFGKPVREA